MSNTYLDRLAKLSSSLVSDAMSSKSVMDSGIKPVNFKRPLVGIARPIDAHVGDNLFVHYAIYEANAGEILVVAGKGYTGGAYIGELMASAAEKLGIGGIIIDGLVRDKASLEQKDIQIYAKGFSPKGPRKDGPGDFDNPISCGGVVVNKGDYIIADEDGITVVPQADIEAVLEFAEKKQAYEEKRLELIANFKDSDDKESLKPVWFNDAFANFNKK